MRRYESLLAGGGNPHGWGGDPKTLGGQKSCQGLVGLLAFSKHIGQRLGLRLI